VSGFSFAESVVEEAALAWRERLGYAVRRGPVIVRILGALEDKLALNRRMNKIHQPIGRARFESGGTGFGSITKNNRNSMPIVGPGEESVRFSERLAAHPGKRSPAISTRFAAGRRCPARFVSNPSPESRTSKTSTGCRLG